MSPKAPAKNALPVLLGTLLAGALVIPALCAAEPAAAPAKPLDFDRDVRAILSENCYACHGFDANKRQAGLRLDTVEGVTAKLPSGKQALVPHHPEQSSLVTRIADHTMPPAYSGKKLTDAQIQTLTRWVQEGGQYAPHWAFVKPARPAVPQSKMKGWALNPIDSFVLAKLEKEGLKPSPAADRATLIRRVTLDLTGLPPTIAEVNAFLGDTQPGAYERLVDRLLASRHYGERMALMWLDLARYADTHGYHIDSQRDMWRWREWVIDAFNKNKPYDKFTVEQIAGDLLPNATLDQKIATGFNRNHPIDFEGGAIPEEYQAAYIFDRIDTTATAFMGLTLRCTQCHDHKYDPFTQKDFYHLYAYFNSNEELGLDGQAGNARPFMKAPTPVQQAQMDQYNAKIAELDQKLKSRAAEAMGGMGAWEETMRATVQASPTMNEGLAAYFGLDEGQGEEVRDGAARLAVGHVRGKASWAPGKFATALQLDGSNYADLGTDLKLERDQPFSYGAWVYRTGADAMTVVSRMDDNASFRGWDLYLSDGKPYVHMIHEWDKNALRANAKSSIPEKEWHHVFVTYDGSSKAKGVKIYIDGKPAEMEITHDTLTDSIQASVPLVIGRRSPGAPFKGMIDEVRIYNRELSAPEVQQLAGFDAIRQIAAVPADKRSPAQQDALKQYYLANYDAPYRAMSAERTATKTQRDELDKAIPTTMVFQEMAKPRETFVLIRGEYDKKGEKIDAPATPAVLNPAPPGAPPNRLGLAEWLVSPDNPLTARVAVNHFWQMYFGTGIVKSAENFGTQGDRPTNQALLDWLATEFMRTGWDVKAMQRLIVTSNTYKQSSRASKELMEKDPENLLLARGPRFRLQAELIRDQALACSGLLVDKIGGPSVKPYQPKGLWEDISFGGGFSAQTYEQDHGDALYRRSMYTFWKRTSPPPSLQTFDAPNREVCVVRRSNSNTPLQALVLENDPTFVEASRKLAERMLTEVAALPKDRIRWAYRIVLDRQPSNEELRLMLDLYTHQLDAFQKDRTKAEKLLTVGEAKRNEKLDVAELAAWTTVANTLLNMDEAITKN